MRGECVFLPNYDCCLRGFSLTLTCSKLDEQFAAAHGCQPLKSWGAKWPLGLDLLFKAFEYDRRQQILQFFLDVVAQSGNTFEQKLLFSRGVDTIEPRNIEAILSSQFSGGFIHSETESGFMLTNRLKTLISGYDRCISSLCWVAVSLPRMGNSGSAHASSSGHNS